MVLVGVVWRRGEVTYGDLGLDFAFVLAEDNEVGDLWYCELVDVVMCEEVLPSQHQTRQHRWHLSC